MRIRQYNEGAKIIIILRQPAHRAYAHWRMETTRGAEHLSFSDAVSAAGRTRMAGEPHRAFSYVERGFYAGQARRVLEQFPRGQVLFITTDGLWNDPTGTVGEVCRFIGTEPPRHVERDYVAPIRSDNTQGIPQDTLNDLNDLYANDLNLTEQLTGRKLSSWRRPDYREPMGD